MTTISIPNSTYLDAYGAGQATAAQMETLSQSTSLANAQAVLGPLFGWGGGTTGTVTAVPLTDTGTVTVGLMLERATELPDSLLSGNWATRQNALAALGSQATVFETYGASVAAYTSVLNAVTGIVGADALSAPTDLGYISSIADRTIWMTIDATEFSALFGTDLLTISSQDSSGHTSSNYAWSGELSLPDNIASHIHGLWFELEMTLPNPVVLNSTPSSPQAGPLGVGNSSDTTVYATSTAIAANYNFPLTSDVATPTIALVEPDVPSQSALLAAYNDYLNAIGLPDAGADQIQFMSGPTTGTGDPSSELTLDMSVIGGAAPNSTQLLYSFLTGTPFNAYQQAFFDFDSGAQVLTSSWGTTSWPTAHSPFQRAYQQLFVDGMLANMSVHIAAGDSGSNGFLANGVANVYPANSPTYSLAVGGTSIASVTAAQTDDTLTDRLALAMVNDPTTVFGLVAAGLRTLPTNLPTTPTVAPSPVLQTLFESVWQTLVLYADGDADNPNLLESDFGTNEAGLGGVNTNLPVPWYQSDFGLLPTSSTGTGRGVPDVSALAYGDAEYAMLNNSYVNDPSKELLIYSGGTSAATPLWASLAAQINAVFADQHLPQLGFYNDLVYMAAAIAPASFNDIRIGTNTDSYYSTFNTVTGYWNYASASTPGGGYYMEPTGDGYAAHEGYDLATGLGTPDGLVLARTLTTIGHTQMNNIANNTSYAVIDVVGHQGGTATMAQTLLVQSNYHAATVVQVDGTSAVDMAANDHLAWTSRLAGQVVQGDIFDSALVTLLDRATKSVPYEITVQAGDTLGVSAGGAALALYQEALTNEYGFIHFGDATGGITLARPVAVAQLADIPGAPADQNAILRIRQNGSDEAQLEVYRVDDLNGTIMVNGNAVTPGQSGYLSAAAGRDYQLQGGGTVIDGPGWGHFKQIEIMGVNQGDYVALKYTNVTTNDVYWAFSQGNAGGVTAIYSYGLNTWGYDDRPVYGDHDYQDIVVQIDFTSTSGHQLIA